MKNLIYDFFNCGDDQIIQFAMTRAHLNKKEKEVLLFMVDDCLTQEEVAEVMDYSPRCIQKYWISATNKMLLIPWVKAYAEYLRNLPNT